MALAIKCDRCKKYYDKNEGIKSINGCFVRGIKIITGTGPYKGLDLFDSCIYELYTFLGMNEEERNE